MGFRPGIAEWLDLLQVAGPVDDVFAGEATVGQTLTALQQARTTWPGTTQDYVAVLDAVAQEVVALRHVIDEQKAFLTRMSTNLRLLRLSLPDGFPVPSGVPVPADRLLNAAELEDLGRLRDELDDLERGVEQWAEDQKELDEEYEGGEDDDEGWG